MKQVDLEKVVQVLGEVKDDTTVPKNVREKIERTITILSGETEMHIKLSKVLSELEEISEDVNLQPYTRTQIWDAISCLENTK